MGPGGSAALSHHSHYTHVSEAFLSFIEETSELVSQCPLVRGAGVEPATTLPNDIRRKKRRFARRSPRPVDTEERTISSMKLKNHQDFPLHIVRRILNAISCAQVKRCDHRTTNTKHEMLLFDLS